MKNHTDNEI